jgi:hypothetical protein
MDEAAVTGEVQVVSRLTPATCKESYSMDPSWLAMLAVGWRKPGASCRSETCQPA